VAKVGRRKRSSRTLIAAAVAFALVGFSLAVRWLGIGRDFFRGGGEAPFQIEVLNGTEEKGIAMAVARELRFAGIDVLIIDNAERFDFGESVLVDRKGNPRLMKRLSKALGCREILEQISPAPLVDATYIIGDDRAKQRSRGRR